MRRDKCRKTRLSSAPVSTGTDKVHKQIQQLPPPSSAKPSIPVKPLHIRPGLKPVKIPTVDDKILVSVKIGKENNQIALKSTHMLTVCSNSN